MINLSQARVFLKFLKILENGQKMSLRESEVSVGLWSLVAARRASYDRKMVREYCVKQGRVLFF